MGTYTTNKNLYMPTVGETGWGTLVNNNFSTIDNFLKPITVSGSTYTFTGNHVGNQSGGSVSATTGTFSGNITAPFFNGTHSGCTLYIVPNAQNVNASFKPYLANGSIYGTGNTPWLDIEHDANTKFPTAGTYTFDVTPRFIVNGLHITKIVNNTSATCVLAGDENKSYYYFTWNGLTIARDSTPSRTIAQINSILQTGMPNTKLIFTNGFSGDDFLPKIRIKNPTGDYLSYYIY